ncbi:MAG: hypothetical protein LBG96_04340 [Tannerella sp.]|jgi:hypothetical protein|nr:hypothetical protein [Tannerella sp.]
MHNKDTKKLEFKAGKAGKSFTEGRLTSYTGIDRDLGLHTLTGPGKRAKQGVRDGKSERIALLYCSVADVHRAGQPVGSAPPVQDCSVHARPAGRPSTGLTQVSVTLIILFYTA